MDHTYLKLLLKIFDPNLNNFFKGFDKIISNEQLINFIDNHPIIPKIVNPKYNI